MGRTPNNRYVVVAQFAGTHGVRGEFKIRSFTDDPEAVFSYGPLNAPNGATLSPRKLRLLKPGVFLCRDEGLQTPEDGARFKGALLSVPRDQLPQTDDDEVYIADLIGLEARWPDGRLAGRVRDVPNYGAGDIVEIKGKAGLMMVPFTHDCVPTIDLEAGFVTIVPPQDDDEDGPSGPPA